MCVVGVRRMRKQSAERHLEPRRDGRVDSLQTSSRHLDMLRDLNRINTHIVSVAHTRREPFADRKQEAYAG